LRYDLGRIRIVNVEVRDDIYSMHIFHVLKDLHTTGLTVWHEMIVCGNEIRHVGTHLQICLCTPAYCIGGSWKSYMVLCLAIPATHPSLKQEKDPESALSNWPDDSAFPRSTESLYL
jgi:hypothetical protein